MSMMATFLSAIAFLGIPAENFVFGFQYILVAGGAIIGVFIASEFFMPIFYDMDSVSVNAVSQCVIYRRKTARIQFDFFQKYYSTNSEFMDDAVISILSKTLATEKLVSLFWRTIKLVRLMKLNLEVEKARKIFNWFCPRAGNPMLPFQAMKFSGHSVECVTKTDVTLY